MVAHPIPNGTNGRLANGRFGKGNPGGPGNPLTKRVNVYRKAFLDAVTEEDIKDAALMLVKAAREGDLDAIGMLLDRAIGKPKQEVEVSGDGPPPVKIIMVQAQQQ